MLHLDLKPENIFSHATGPDSSTLKIGDFGIAVRKAQWDDHEGDGRYMAPELLGGAGGIDTTADIFSLGLIFYEMLTGATLHSGGDQVLSPAPF